MNVNTIANRARRNAGNTEGDITYRCGHAEGYRGSSAYGWAMVAGMSAEVDCEQCHTRTVADAERIAPMMHERRAAFDAAVALRNKRMLELSIDDVTNEVVRSEHRAVMMALRLITEAERANDVLRENGGE